MMAQLHRYKRLYSSETLASNAVQESRKVVGLIPAPLCVVCMGWCGKQMSWFSSEILGESRPDSQPEQMAVLRSDQGRSGSWWRESSPLATTDTRERHNADGASEDKQHFRSFRGDNSVTWSLTSHDCSPNTLPSAVSLSLSVSENLSVYSYFSPLNYSPSYNWLD